MEIEQKLKKLETLINNLIEIKKIPRGTLKYYNDPVSIKYKIYVDCNLDINQRKEVRIITQQIIEKIISEIGIENCLLYVSFGYDSSFY